MGSSDRSRKWPAAERRSATPRRTLADRRSGRDRRADAAPVVAERRQAAERRKGKRRTRPDRRNEASWEAVTLDMQPVVQTVAEDELLKSAVDARGHAHARYSGFAVGAALETADGQIVTGCNIENATYGLTLCAERVALVKALSEGHAVFTRIAVAADTEGATPPCGPCRQLLWEYCGDIDIILGNLEGVTGRHRLSALLPLPFDARLLG